MKAPGSPGGFFFAEESALSEALSARTAGPPLAVPARRR